MSPVENKIKEILGELSGHAPDSIDSSTEMGGIPGWDSVGHLTLVQRLSDHYGKEVPFEQLTELTSISKIGLFFSDS